MKFLRLFFSLTLATVPALYASGQTITEFPISRLSLADGITPGPDGNLWVCEGVAHGVARVTPSGEVTEFPVNGIPHRITVGPDKNLWFSEYDNRIGRMSVEGSVFEFQLPPAEIPRAPRYPEGITAGPDGNLWFADSASGNRIGRFTPAGRLDEFKLLAGDTYPNTIATGPDGNLWYTETGAFNIGRITPSGVITEFPLPTRLSTTIGIAAGPDGNLWFTEYSGTIGRISVFGEVTEFPIPSENPTPWQITQGPDGAMWFTERDGNKIGRITMDGVISEFAIPTPGSAPSGITSGPDGNIWFTETYGHKVGRLNLVAPRCSPDPTAVCLGERFRVSLNWQAPTSSGIGMGIPLTTDAGAFWFFSANNIEIVVKVVDGRAFNGKFWVFYGSLTNVAFTLSITDTHTGITKTYANGQGELASVADTSAF
ncbi:MAG: hypothetical protein ABI682_10480 [Acidobacteriota bacterium]